ncbi:hypothetical protein SBADM41S_04914 [Streptomyces badius]
MRSAAQADERAGTGGHDESHDLTEAPATSPTPAPPPRWAVRAAHLTALVVLPSGLWRIALVLGHPAGYTEAGFEPFATADAKVWMLALSVVSELVALLTIGLVCRGLVLYRAGSRGSAGAKGAPHGRCRPRRPGARRR